MAQRHKMAGIISYSRFIKHFERRHGFQAFSCEVLAQGAPNTVALDVRHRGVRECSAAYSRHRLTRSYRPMERARLARKSRKFRADSSIVFVLSQRFAAQERPSLRATEWLPGMDSNHELDRILMSHNLLILRSH